MSILNPGFYRLATVATLCSVFALASTPAQAQVVTGADCIKERIGGNPPCSANDVRITAISLVSGPANCVVGADYTATLEIEVESGPERFDIGLWFNEDGDSALSDPDGTCTRDYFEPVNAVCDQDGGPYYDGDDDTCGDTPKASEDCTALERPCSAGGGTCFVTTRQVDVTLECIDTDLNGFADVGTCTSWNQGADPDDCAGTLDTDPGSGSKCNCSRVSTEVPVIPPGCAADDECDNGLFCDGTETCNAGVCIPGTPETDGTNCGDAGDGQCDLQDTCDGAGTCVNRVAAENANCGSAGDGQCDLQDTCDDAGICQDNLAAGNTNCGSAGDGQCDLQDTCDDAGSCDDNIAAENANCGSAGDGQCDLQDTCDDAGSCDDNIAAENANCGSAGDGQCDLQDTCDDAGSCDDNLVAENGDCGNAGDGQCDLQDTCDDGGTCNDNVAAENANCGSAGDGQCDLQDTCDDAGSCDDNVAAENANCGSAGDGQCDLQDTCDDAGSCDDNVAAENANCGSAGDGQCDLQDTCDDAGTCDDNVAAENANCGSAGDGQCDLQDTCDDAGTCDDNIAAENANCGSAGDGQCDLQDTCDDAGTCDDNIEAESTDCGDAGDGQCDLQDTCNGGGSCVDNLAAENADCGNAGDGQCDLQDTCDDAGSCVDNLAAENADCGNAGDGQCDLQDTCDDAGSCIDNLAAENADCNDANDCTSTSTAAGDPDLCDDAGNCQIDFVVIDGACGSEADTQCTDPDSCDGAGTCLNNNTECGSVTSSSLCEFDVEPDKGTCVETLDGLLDGTACSLANGDADCESAPAAADGTCEQSAQFRAIFSPDVQNWAAYRLNGSNPGQTFYNIIYDASGAPGDVTLNITIPYPYVTVGGMPLHVYDGATVGTDASGCLDPSNALLSGPLFVTLQDWADGTAAGNYNLNCDEVDESGEDGYCTFDVTIPSATIDASVSGLLYVNLHLDYGLKGPGVDALPVGADQAGLIEDRYDRHAYISPWDSSDALENSGPDNGPVAIPDCKSHVFSHTDDIDPLFTDAVENLNIFKRIAGTFARVWCADDDIGYEGLFVRLVHPTNGVVLTTETDEDGYYALNYRHRGKRTAYLVEVYTDAGLGNLLASVAVELQGNGWAEAAFWATDCDTVPVWETEVTYGKGGKKK